MDPRLLYLDGTHQTEVPFLQSLTDTLAEQHDAPTVLVHGSGAFAEQALEGRGLFPERENGVLRAETEEEFTLVDRATRQFNKKLVALLTEEGVPAVGATGTSRNLLRLEMGRVKAHRTAWLAELLEGGTVPVVATLAYDPDEERIREVPPVEVIVALARRLSAEVVCFAEDDEPSEPETVRAVREADVPVTVAASMEELRVCESESL
jgi:acetylglutamate kinase